MKVTEILESDDYSPSDIFGFKDERIAVARKQAQKLADYLKDNCSPWLQQTNNGDLVVYRGFNDDSRIKKAPAFIKAVRQNRKPRDSYLSDHNYFNEVIRRCGKKANRSNSVFVSGSMQEAEHYGFVYIVIPIGDFNYTWSTKFSDWTTAARDLKSYVKPELDLDNLGLSKKELIEIENQITQDFFDQHKRAKYILLPIFEIRNKDDQTVGDILNGRDLLTFVNGFDLLRYVNDVEEKEGAVEFKWESEDSSTAWETNRQTLANILKFFRSLTPEQKNKFRSILNAYSDALPNPVYHNEYHRQKMHEFRMSRIQGKKFTPSINIKKKLCPLILGDDGTLEQAINSDHEIMIRCKKIVAVQEHFYTLVKRLLDGKTLDDDLIIDYFYNTSGFD